MGRRSALDTQGRAPAATILQRSLCLTSDRFHGGHYSIGPQHTDPTRGPTVMALTPVGHNALGRTGFLIHGNNIANDASTGCVILPPNIRSQIANSTDHDLNVVP